MSMISYAEAREIVLAHAPLMPPQNVPLSEALGGFLAEPVTAPFDLPRFDNTAVDGFAVKLADVATASEEAPVKLRVLGTVRAGDEAREEITAGSAAKVLTGSPLPAGTEAVVMKEYTRVTDGYVSVERSVALGENVRRHGEEFRKGDAVLEAGTRVTPPVIGLLASSGMEAVPVRAKPKVALIITGNELVQQGKELGEGQIYDSNSAALSSALRQLPVELISVNTCADVLELLVRHVRSGLEQADVVITVGGASVGDYDFVEEALRRNGVTMHFNKVAMKPGKPTIFGAVAKEQGNRVVFGVPGNPVSALVCFAVFIRPALLKMAGAPDADMPLMKARLGAALRKKPGRFEFVRARLSWEDGSWVAYPTTGQESHMLSGLAAADALIYFPAEMESREAGQFVMAERLPW